MARIIAETKSPGGCCDAEIAAFCCYVRQGGEVESVGLEDRARNARALVFLYVDRALVGVAALKRPTATYRDGKFRSAGVQAMKSRYRQRHTKNTERGRPMIQPRPLASR